MVYNKLAIESKHLTTGQKKSEVRSQTEKLHFSVRGQTLKMQVSDNQYFKLSLGAVPENCW